MKEAWREKWLGSINELTSLDLQGRSWRNGANTNPRRSFVEFMRSYFDDLSLGNNYKYALENGLVTNAEFEIIRAWHEALDAYHPPNNHEGDEAILKDIKWIDIVVKGYAARQELKKILPAGELPYLAGNGGVIQ
jgi:hypothetical protein